jgi:hypothetical protein
MTGTEPRPDQHDASPDESRGLQRLLDDLATRFPTVPPAQVADHIKQAAESYGDAPVREFIPVLVARQVQARLAGDNQTTEPEPN